MKKWSIAILSSILSFSLGSLAKPGGWGSSGGGSGVACFTNSEIAKKADAFIGKSLPLSTEVKKDITTLETLDYWEWANTKSYPLFETAGLSQEAIIKKLQSRIQFVAPIFIYRLQQTTEIISTTDWSGMKSVPRIYDAKPAKALPENCRLVQLAARYTKDKYTKGAGPTLKSPVVKIDFDKDLFEKLSPLNQAILIVHEQMYLLGQTTGANTSDYIRPMVMRLFADRMSERQTRYNLVGLFGDYVMFFGEDFKAKGPVGSQESRFNSFYEVLRSIRAQIRACGKAKGIPLSDMSPEQEIEHKACLDGAMIPWATEATYTDEQAFVFMFYYVVDISMQAFNAESIIAPIKNVEFEELAQTRLRQSCAYLKNNAGEFALEKLVSQAQAYCALLSLAPMGTNQN